MAENGTSNRRQAQTAAPEIDGVARALAGNAGVLWDGLNDYPGYGKTYWREQARAIIAVISPHAVFQEPAASFWDTARG